MPGAWKLTTCRAENADAHQGSLRERDEPAQLARDLAQEEMRGIAGRNISR